MTLNKRDLIVFFSLLFWVAVAVPASAASVCFECHSRDAFRGVIVHQPVAKDRCVECHNPHAAKEKGLLSQKVKSLCYSCHVSERKKFQKDFVHQPVKQGECLACHDAHVSNVKGLLKGAGADVCFACHGKVPREFKYSHAPFAKGNCMVCHQPHQASNQRLLRFDSSDKLCLSCHKQQKLGPGHAGYQKDLRDCLSCHSPHGSSRKGMVREFLHDSFEKGCKGCHAQGKTSSEEEACLACHEPVRKQMFVAHSHLGVQEGNSCLACHSPHAGDTQALLKASTKHLCRGCHADTIQRYADRLYKHPKAAAGECIECHAVHGSNLLGMTRADGIGLCSGCHESQGQFSHPVGDKIRDPRTGKAMTCSDCHNPMGTDFKGNLILSGAKDLCVQCHQNK